MAKITFSLDDWVLDEIISSASLKNRSGRIQELIIKGHFFEQLRKKTISRELSHPEQEDARFKTLAHDLIGFRNVSVLA